MFLVGWRILSRERLRLAVLVFGVAFAVILVSVEMGMLLGLVENASLLIDRSPADLWVYKVDVKTFEFATPIDPRKKFQISSVPGVERVEEFIYSPTFWRLPSGGTTHVQVVGFELDSRLAPQLEAPPEALRKLHDRDAVLVDRSECGKLAIGGVGERFEVLNRRARVVGFTEQMRSFTTTPFIFTSLRRSHQYGWATEGGRWGVYFLVKVAKEWTVEAVRRRILETVEGVEVQTGAEFSARTRRYWLLETGVGIGFVVAAVLGLLVGGVITAQILYALTVERLAEFAVLKALGATMRELYGVVFTQSAIGWALGLALGLFLSALIANLATWSGTKVVLPAPLLGAVALLSLALCGAAGWIALRKLRSLAPVQIFQA